MTKKTILYIFIKRRILIDELNKLVFEVKGLSHIEDPKFYVTSVKDLVRFFIFSQNELAKVISERSNTNMYEFYSEIEENILNYLRNILHEK
jgi:hypothetical protein